MERNADAPQVLRPGGWLVIALGFGSRDYVANLLGGWRDVQIDPDLAGIPRVIAARRAVPESSTKGEGTCGNAAPSRHMSRRGTAVE